MEIDVNIKKTNGETERIKYGPQAKYDKENTTRVYIKLNKNTDSDIIEYLEKSGNKQGLIKELIRREIEKEQSAEETLKEISDRATAHLIRKGARP